MRRVIAIALAFAGASLGGCSSSSFGDYFKSTPPNVQVQLESQPAGADAKTSVGPGCKTPCSVSIPAPEGGNFTVSYTLAKYQPATVPVSVTITPGGLTSSATAVTDPNPVFAELQPAGPPPKVRKMHPRKKPKPAAPAAAAAPAAQDAAFPNPNAAPPPAGAPGR